MILTEGGDVLSTRNYTEWGNVEVDISDHIDAFLVDKLIRKDFAYLIRPYGANELVSESRIYSPAHGEWLIIDSSVLWNPEVIVKGHLDEIDGFRYAGGDPLNFVDPSGHAAHVPVALAIGAVIGGGAAGLAAYQSGARGWDLVRTTLVGAGSGAASVTGFGDVFGGMLIGLGGNYATQVAASGSFNNLDHISAGISMISAGVGGGMGQLASKYMQVPMKYFNSIVTIGFNWLNASEKIISAGVGGSIGGQGLYQSFNSSFSTDMDFGGSTQSSPSDSFSDSWWNQ